MCSFPVLALGILRGMPPSWPCGALPTSSNEDPELATTDAWTGWLDGSWAQMPC